jgi:hypothetical protein
MARENEDHILFLAASGDQVHFGLHEDPAAWAARREGETPITIVAGWVLPPEERRLVLSTILRDLRDEPRDGIWFQIPRARAEALLAEKAGRAGGAFAYWVPGPAAPRTSRDRPVITEQGRFDSAAEAAEAFGISRQAAWKRASVGINGWKFEDAG